MTAPFGIAAYFLLTLLAFVMSGCLGKRFAASPAPQTAVSACGEGMLAAQAWKCLASRAAHP